MRGCFEVRCEELSAGLRSELHTVKDIRHLILGYAMICGVDNIGGVVSCHLFGCAGGCAGGSIKGYG